MIVKCIADSGNEIPSEKREGFCTEFTQFGIDIGKEYTVFAIVYYDRKNARIDYLVADDLGYPLFIPSDLFEVIDGSLPADWSLYETTSASYKFKVIGYSAMSEYSHYQGLVEREQVDIDIFAKARKEIEGKAKSASKDRPPLNP